jgi:hypothetical protein
MQKQSKLISTINLSENYPKDDLSNLLKIFPQLNELVAKKNGSNFDFSHKPAIVDKFEFYHIILEKIKNYFEIKETFVISDSISIMLKDIKSFQEQMNQKKLKLDEIKKNVKFPLINDAPKKNLPDIESDKFIRKAKRNYSTKSNGNEKINGPKKPCFKTFDFEEKDVDINYVYMNLDQGKKEKKRLKVVKFLEGGEGIGNEKSRIKMYNKTFTRKSNLKKSNIKKELNRSNTVSQSTKSDTRKESKSKTKYYLKTNTEYPLRKKSNGKILQKDDTNKIYEDKKIISLSKPFLDFINLNEFNINDKDFDIFDFNEKVGRENTLELIGRFIYDYFEFWEIVNKTKYNCWCRKISEGYNRNNFYHTDLHAADIAHTSYIYFKEGSVNGKIQLDKLSICAIILSCICHDYKHPGLNNNYLMETNDSIAIRYNDISILENMHISETFKLIHSDPNCNIFEDFVKEKYKKIRKQMISCVIGTDMSNHKHSLEFMNKCLNDKKEISDEDKEKYMNLIVHSADISNPTKSFVIYYKWAELVVQEFYQQGDKEKELGLNCSCDRNKVSLYKSQLGFINYVEIPFYGLFVKVFPKLNFLLENLNNNRERIKLLEDEDNKNKIENK